MKFALKLTATLTLSILVTSTAFAGTLLTCKQTAKDSFVKSLVLIKNGDSFSAKMESVIEDGVIDIQIKTPVVTATSTNYILVEDHDLKVTLSTYGKKAVVLTESVDDASEPTHVEFLTCK